MDRQKKAAAFGKGGQENAILENLRSKSNSELMAEIDVYMKKADEQGFDFDPGYIEDRLVILQERDPIEIDFDPTVEIFKLPLNLEAMNNKQNNKRRVKIWRIVEIAAALVIILAIAAGAGGFDIFDWLRKEHAETISFSTESSGEMKFKIGSTAAEQEYDSLQAALDAYGITAEICPTWIPEDYYIVSVDVFANEDVVRLVGGYKSEERGTVSIQFTRFSNSGATITSEIEPDGELYERNGIKYYLFPNMNQNKCHWSQEGFTCVINGNLSFDELKQMVDSIGAD